MNLIDEQHVPRLEIGEQRRQVPGTFQHRTRGLAQIDPKLIGDDVRERGFAEAGRSEYQDVIESLAALARRLDENVHLRFDIGLTDIVGERFRPHRPIDDFIVAAAGACNDAILFDAHAVVTPSPLI